MDGLLANKRADAKVVTLAEGLPGIAEDGEVNPHFWLDVRLAKLYVERIRDALIEIDASGRPTYEGNATAYLAELDSLDAEIRGLVQEVPERERKLVTSHDAFPYFAKAYGFEVVGFTQTEEGKEPSAGEIAELVEKVKAARPRAVFVEEGFPQSVAEALAREAGVAKVIELHAPDSLTAEAGSYVVLMREIATEIADALK
jgi:ABC-type Zn uptake system ZnuABC Zn-binding protein ZnuA